jgi:lipoprotein NlpI
MMRYWLGWLAAGVLLASSAFGVEPNSDLAAQLQLERRQSAERRLVQASQIIEAGTADDKQLAEAFRARGIARSHLLQYAEALADFNRAVELEPLDAQLYEERAITHLKLREFKEANRDLDMALGLDRARVVGHREKGRLAAYQKDFTQAAREFNLALQSSDDAAIVYGALWLHVAIRRGGLEGEAPLAAIDSQLDLRQWPAPVVKMYLGQLQPQEVVAAASTSNPRTSLMQLCEAYFYVGQEYLIRNQPAQARASFQAAVDTGVTEFLEYDWSARELELMK